MSDLFIPTRFVSRMISGSYSMLLPWFFALIFLPSIVKLCFRDAAAAQHLAAMGPVAGGFWLSSRLAPARVNTVILGTVLAGALALLNWLAGVEFDCCGLN